MPNSFKKHEQLLPLLAEPFKIEYMNQILDNPFPYSNTNKRYHTFSYATKEMYHHKVAKIPLNAGFTCPNRDGTKSVGGCRFCSSNGSGDTILSAQSTLETQFTNNLKRAQQKWPDCLGIPYFQSFSNTYAPLELLKKIYTPFYQRDDIVAIAIATRTDCFTEEQAKWFSKQEKTTWLEFGLQSIHDETAKAMNFAHSAQDAKKAIELCHRYHLKSCLHIINGLPNETEKMMLETAKFVADLHPDAIKIHMLHLLDNSVLGQEWKQQPFDLLTLEQYVSITCDQLEILPSEMIIERVTGDGLASDLLAPLWTQKKTIVANEIDKELLRRNSWQGKYYVANK